MAADTGEANVVDARRKAVTAQVAPFRVPPDRRIRLPRDFDPAYKPADLKKEDAVELLARGVALLAELQTKLAAQSTYGVLLVVQALDAAGKDGTIKHVMSGVNPQGVDVHAFKQPSVEDLSHDFLWRYQQRIPARGRIGIFNRSHYEEALVVRVHPEWLDHQNMPASAKRKDVWERRFREINDWERYLCTNGIKVVKVFLNVSKEQQRRRFLARIDEPEKNWKLSVADVDDRARWDDYQAAYADVLSHTSTPWAPWYVVPADRKWFARIATAAVLIDTLMEIDPQFPTANKDLIPRLAEIRAHLEAEGSD